jgi:hypothetical protein
VEAARLINRAPVQLAEVEADARAELEQARTRLKAARTVARLARAGWSW